MLGFGASIAAMEKKKIINIFTMMKSKVDAIVVVLMLQQQILMCRGVAGAGESGLLQMSKLLDGGDIKHSEYDIMVRSSST